MTKKPMTVCRYRTLRECMAAHGGLGDGGKWVWADADGSRHSLGLPASLRRIRAAGFWGWVEDKTTIHVWISKRADPARVIGMFAHELGHIEHPHSRDVYTEETKAARYARVTERALEIARDLGVF